jgi:hypothetical protein
MRKKDEKEFYHVFEDGDLLRSQDGYMVVITEVKDGQYKLIHLQSQTIKVIGDIIEIKKGSIGTQPCSVVDKYYFLYQPK